MVEKEIDGKLGTEDALEPMKVSNRLCHPQTLPAGCDPDQALLYSTGAK